MEVLSLDLLGLVFSFCVAPPSPQSIHVLSRVCKRFHEATWRSFFKLCVLKLTERGVQALLQGNQMLRSSFFFVTKIEVATTDAKVVENLVSVSPNLSSLRLMWAGFSEEICFSLSKLPSLRSLRVQFYPNPKWRQAQGETVGMLSKLENIEALETRITNDEIMTELGKCKKLKNLNCRGSGSLSSQGLINMGTNLCLQSLDLSDNFAITDDGLLSIFSACEETLEHLDVSHCEKVTDCSVAGLRKCGNIKSFRASFCRNISGVGFENFHHDCSSITSIDLSFNGFSDSSLCFHLAKCSSLLSLNLSRVKGQTLDGILALSNLTSLEKLFVFLDGTFGDAELNLLNFPVNLIHLSLGASLIERVPKKLALLPRLSILTLENCKGITCSGFAAVQNCVHLLRISIASCSKLEDKALHYLFYLPRLQIVDINGALCFSPAAKKALVMRFAAAGKPFQLLDGVQDLEGERNLPNVRELD